MPKRLSQALVIAALIYGLFLLGWSFVMARETKGKPFRIPSVFGCTLTR